MEFRAVSWFSANPPGVFYEGPYWTKVFKVVEMFEISKDLEHSLEIPRDL
jgi:hypothetical protein